MTIHRIHFLTIFVCLILFFESGGPSAIHAEEISYQLPSSHQIPSTQENCPNCQSAGPATEASPVPQYYGSVPQGTAEYSSPRDWEWEWLPDGLVYKSYLAGPKEPRFKSVWVYDSNRGWIWDVTLGGRFGLLRKGTSNTIRPQGWQLDMEGAVFPRLDMEFGEDLESADFRFGIPLTWSNGPLQMKLAYYHISAHVGDEYLIRNPGFQRINYVRDSIVLGFGYYLTKDLRLYSEGAYAFNSNFAQPWEFQFGAEYSPHWGNGGRGAPFFGINGMLFEEHDFGGNLNILAGWQWRGPRSDRLFRFGLQYFNGKSSQYAFYKRNEQLIGAGFWFDY